MDIEQLRTLLEVNRTRHFRQAGEELFVSQSTVSARIKKLEEELGVNLFNRQSRDIHLTPEGHRLIRHAESIIALWRKARQDAALVEEGSVQLAVGGMFSLWDILLQDWIHTLHHAVPRLALIAEAHGHELLLRRLLDGALELIFVFEPPQLEEVLIEEVTTIPLIMVSSQPHLGTEDALMTNYTLVDWGHSYALQHTRQFPDAPPPAQRMNQGHMALAFLLTCGGAAYLAEQTVTEHLAQGNLHRVADAPTIIRHAYGVYLRRSARRDLIEKVLEFFAKDRGDVRG